MSTLNAQARQFDAINSNKGEEYVEELECSCGCIETYIFDVMTLRVKCVVCDGEMYTDFYHANVHIFYKEEEIHANFKKQFK